jgi:DNA-binding NarL/FixJ family response regulator
MSTSGRVSGRVADTHRAGRPRTRLARGFAANTAAVTYIDQHADVRYQRASDIVDVVLVEDHALFRQGLSEMLSVIDPLIRVAGHAESAEEALRLVPETAPDIVLMDVHLPAMSGIEAIRRLAVLCPRTRAVVVSGSAEDDSIMEALLAGACGYIVKSAPIDEIASAIRTAAQGGSIISPAVASQLLDYVRQNRPPLSIAAEPVGQLTPREGEVLRLLAAGMENSEIAQELVISTRTARNHVASILEKLQMQNRIQAAVYAVKHGLA